MGMEKPEETNREEKIEPTESEPVLETPVIADNEIIKAEDPIDTSANDEVEQVEISQPEEEIAMPPEEAGAETQSLPTPELIESPEKEPVDNASSVSVDTEEKETIDYAALSKEDLVAVLLDLIQKGDFRGIRDDIEQIKLQFYKKHNADLEKKHKIFLEDGGLPEDFKPEEEPIEKEVKDLLNRYRDFKSELNKQLESEKQHNLEKKYKVIEEISELIKKNESINKTFQEFRELQKRWHDIGPVPQQNLNDLWENYHHHVEKFYGYIKINQELRDLDLKRNLEAKLALCEKAEQLLLNSNIIDAFKTLQELHALWREIGPVTAEMRTEIWDRFKEATSRLNKKHQEHFVGLKQEQKDNLEAKSALCEKVEAISNKELNSAQEWDKASNELIELQNTWKTIGFAPKKENTKVYQRFREACDGFFNRKREFFNEYKQEQDDNLQKKTELCIQAEALQDSTDWRKTTEELIELQKRWKQVGPVPYKFSDKIWKRFRRACDNFFKNKSSHFASAEASYEENLKKKESLINQIESIELTTDNEANLTKLNELQREWAAIGFVPIEAKEKIQQHYRQAINTKFDKLKIDDEQKNLFKFKTKLESLNKKHNDHRVNQERDRMIVKIKQLENDIILWENNIGFFAKSKNADALIQDVKDKIEDARQKIVMMTEKVKIIDDLDE